MRVDAEAKHLRWELIERRDTGAGGPEALLDRQIKDWLLANSALDEVLVGAVGLAENSGLALPGKPLDQVINWTQEVTSNQPPDTITTGDRCSAWWRQR